MPRKTKYETIQCRHFRWIVRRRSGVYQADGRSNRPNPGRHSLGTKDRSAALNLLEQLDRTKAVELGLADPSEAITHSPNSLDLQAGADAYLEHLARPAVAGGAKATSRKRYRAVFDKFIDFAAKRSITVWSQVTDAVFTAYLTDLDRGGYAERTIYLEGILIKQFMRWAINQNLIPKDCRISVRLTKLTGTTTYCWKPAEVKAMLDHCRKSPGLAWLGLVILLLSRTGLRISEAAALRWQDIDFERNMIHVANDNRSARNGTQAGRSTKNREDRWCPMPSDLRQALLGQRRAQDGRALHGPHGGALKADTVRVILIREVIKPLKSRFPTTSGELGFEHGRLHSFRHFFCSACANQGVPERMVIKWLGHKDSSMLRVYYHMNDDDAQRQIQRVDFGGGSGGNGAVGNPPAN